MIRSKYYLEFSLRLRRSSLEARGSDGRYVRFDSIRFARKNTSLIESLATVTCGYRGWRPSPTATRGRARDTGRKSINLIDVRGSTNAGESNR